MSSNRVTLLQANGWRGYYYYMLFPLDLFGPDTDDRLAYQQTKVDELVPIYGWLLPLIVGVTALIPLPWYAVLLLFSLAAGLLALLTKFHLKLAGNQTVEVWLNAWLAMVGFAISLALIAFVFGGLSNPEINWD